ncbi:glycoside hydrolase [Dichotomopilus funicola]|uniref:cellulase n=1 Tax=Dichotomopilus funicola TaxID=1934379 RepID=A0AAN6V610_9PEZI|nr:glycoside hydrolase [Dichotomopilus funicola]
MKFLNLFLGAAAAGSALAAPSATKTTKTTKRAGKFQHVGVNESGAEFGQTSLPGQYNKDYTWPAEATIDTLVSQGFNTFRIPFSMERLVPTELTGAVNETYSEGLTGIVSYITGKGAYAIVDPHNFGRYYDNIITDVDGFKAWWTTTATIFADNELVIFDTNNEYHDMDNDLVFQLNQGAIDAIRGAGATSQLIFVEGNSYTGAWTWIDSGNGETLLPLSDPQDKLVYEMHQYLDTDGSGTHEECVSSTIGQERIQAATQWLKDNGKLGIIGEFAGGANSQCIDAITGMLSYMSDNSDVWTGWLWWGGGPWWGDYMYSMEPPSGVAYTGVLPSILPYL